MELLLNLLWLTLALPAVWLWRRGPAVAVRPNGYYRLRMYLLLACVLILLFPIVSATDDLHPMRAEMEELNPGKHVVKISNGGVAAAGHFTFGAPAPVPGPWIFSSHEVCGRVTLGSFTVPHRIAFTRAVTRPPPSFLLG